MKVFFNRIPRYEPFGGGSHFVTAMNEYLIEKGHKTTFELEEGIDVMFMIDPRPGDIGYSVNHILAYKQQFPETKILHRINECDARKNTEGLDTLLIESAKRADKVVFISYWLQDYFIRKGFYLKDAGVIYNGCKTEHFYPRKDQKIGSKVRLVTHHWSDNWMKGFDLYKNIDEWLGIDNNSDNFEFTYVGRYCKEYTPENTNLVSPLHGKELGNEIRKHDIYVTASRFEPCGMHHIEGAASGLPVIYHKDTGGIVEMCARHGESYVDFEDFLKKLNIVKENINVYKEKIDYNSLDIAHCCESFYKELIDMQNEKDTLL